MFRSWMAGAASGVSALALALAATAALADDSDAATEEGDVIIAVEEPAEDIVEVWPIETGDDGLSHNPDWTPEDGLFVIDPICFDCSGEVEIIEVITEEVIAETTEPDVEITEEITEVVAEETGEPDIQLDFVEIDGETVVLYDNPESICDGCEAWTAGGPEVQRDESTDRGTYWTTAEVAQSPNICTTPELYVAWLCEWQGFPRP